MYHALPVGMNSKANVYRLILTVCCMAFLSGSVVHYCGCVIPTAPKYKYFVLHTSIITMAKFYGHFQVMKPNGLSLLVLYKCFGVYRVV